MRSLAKRLRRAEWRARLARDARIERNDARVNRAIAIERERARRLDASAQRMAVAIAEVAERPRGDLVRAAECALIREVREERATITVSQGDRLALRAQLLGRMTPVVLDGVPVQSTARVAAIVETSDTVIPAGARFDRSGREYPVTWVYDGDSIETYRRVVARRSKGGAW